jgi:hypothetical protein
MELSIILLAMVKMSYEADNSLQTICKAILQRLQLSILKTG